MKPERSKATLAIPCALARSAMARPTALAASMLPVVFNSPRTSFCKVDAATRTLSPSGAKICAQICCGLRCTERRRAASSLIFTRPRSARRRRVSRLSSFISLLLLRFFQRNLLVRIFHPLALVGFRRAEPADLGGRLSDLLAVDPFDDDFRLARRFDGHALRDCVIDEMREAERQSQALGLHRGAIADADEFELLLIALGYARHHVREGRARRARDGVQPFRGRTGLDLETFVLEPVFG